MSVSMTALRSFSYGTRAVSTGDVVDVRPEHVRVLSLMGKARTSDDAVEAPADADEAPVSTAPVPRRRGRPRKAVDSSAEPAARVYQRRDMVAEHE